MTLLMLLAACGTGAPTSAPTGIDELVVPTASPRPRDFVADVDNSWLAWVRGTTTTYDTTQGRVLRKVGAATTPIDGLAATVVTTRSSPRSPATSPTGTQPTSTTDYYAQDRRGNVWWLGREGEWQVGRDGAEAGLWMPAAPRLGDGFRTARAPAVVGDLAVLADVVLAPPPDAGSAYDPANLEDGSAGDEVRIRLRSELDPSRVEVWTYIEGTGLVAYSRSGSARDDDTVWTREG